MIEKRFKTVEQIDLLEAWMAAPTHAKPEVPFDAAFYLQRLQLAHDWLVHHGGNTRKVWPMLVSHYKAMGISYSESTARRDVEDAIKLYVTINPQRPRWTTEFMLNSLLRDYDAASKAGKHAECARLAGEVRKFIDKYEGYVRDDATRNISEIPIEAVFDLDEAGIERDPNIRQKIAAWQKQRETEKLLPPNTTDAEIEEDAP